MLIFIDMPNKECSKFSWKCEMVLFVIAFYQDRTEFSIICDSFSFLLGNVSKSRIQERSCRYLANFGNKRKKE